MKTQQLFAGKWVQTTHLTISDSTCPKLRGSQPQAFKALKDRKHVILNAPTGWGKSLVIVFLIVYKLLKHKNLRCIITVPQTLIASGFTGGKGKEDWKIKIGRKLIPWVVNMNLCHSEASDTIRQLIAFLNSRYTRLGDRVLICTHATLARTYQKLAKQGRLDLFDNTLLWIDEAHHVMNAQVLGGGTISNSIGALVRHCVANGNPIGLATATFMRGDMHHIIPEQLLRKFVRFNVPYDVYFNEMQPVASFEFNIICGDLMEALDSIFKKMCPTILYLAKRNSRYATRCKYSEVEKIVRQLSRRLGQPIRRTDTLIHLGDLRILDLVTEKGRHRRKAYLDNGGQVDLIIALDTCKEGFDWPKAERSIIIGERHSVPEMIQMIGRLFRRAEGKTHAEVFQIMPAVVENGEVYKDHCNAVLSVVFAAMLLEDIFVPMPLNGVPVPKKHRRQEERLAALIPDTDAWQSLVRDFLMAAQGRSFDESWRIGPSVLKRHGIPRDKWLNVWKRLWHRLAAINQRANALRLDMPFELLKNVDVTGGLMVLASGLCGADTFNDLRKVIGRTTHTLEECVMVAEELAAKYAIGEAA